MSDNWIALVPYDPAFVPDVERQVRARELFSQLAPFAEQIEIVVAGGIQFFDCGQNLERVGCPRCTTALSRDWWIERINEDWVRDSRREFKLAAYATPCCNSLLTLNDLIYDWPQGFGRFGLEVMNPYIGRLTRRERKKFEEILGTRLRVIYQHV